MRIIVSLVVLGLGIYLIVAQQQYEWAYSFIGLIIGYWLQPIQSK